MALHASSPPTAPVPAGPAPSTLPLNDDVLREHRNLVSASIASCFGTIAGFPFDSIKVRQQSQGGGIVASVRAIVREDGVKGFFRGMLIPLVSISLVRTTSFGIYDSTKRRLAQETAAAAADDGSAAWIDLSRPSLRNTALLAFIGGATSGLAISLFSCPMELAKIRRQLETLIAKETTRGGAMGATRKEMGSWRAMQELVKTRGPGGLYIGFRLHCARDTLGTGLYFLLYDSLKYLALARRPNSPTDIPAHASTLSSLLAGGACGISSWTLIYPLDLLKSRYQYRSLTHPVNTRTITMDLRSLLAGGESEQAGPGGRPGGSGSGKPIATSLVRRVARLYKGLGVSMWRSAFVHALYWSIYEKMNARLGR